VSSLFGLLVVGKYDRDVCVCLSNRLIQTQGTKKQRTKGEGPVAIPLLPVV
jgi:hypothetical protein